MLETFVLKKKLYKPLASSSFDNGKEDLNCTFWDGLQMKRFGEFNFEAGKSEKWKIILVDVGELIDVKDLRNVHL